MPKFLPKFSPCGSNWTLQSRGGGHIVCGRRLLDWVVTFNGYEIYNFDNGDHNDNYDFVLEYSDHEK